MEGGRLIIIDAPKKIAHGVKSLWVGCCSGEKAILLSILVDYPSGQIRRRLFSLTFGFIEAVF
jgi:hypothetical protein